MAMSACLFKKRALFAPLIRHRFISKKSKQEEIDFAMKKDPNYPLLASFKLVDDTYNPNTSTVLTPNPNDSTILTPNVNLINYNNTISELIRNFEHQTFKGIPRLNHGLPSSYDSWGTVTLDSPYSSTVFLCGKFNMLPVCAETEQGIVVLNQELWKYVHPGYAWNRRDKGPVTFRSHEFHRFEKNHSFHKVIRAIDIVAAGVPNMQDMSMASAIATLVQFTTHSSFISKMKKHFQHVLADEDPSRESYVPP